MPRLLPLACLILFALHHRAPADATGIHWPENQILPTFAAPKNLTVVDLLTAEGDLRLLMAGAQGIVNRATPSIYLLEPSDEGPETWLAALKTTHQREPQPLKLIETHRAFFKGIVIYDPNFPDSVNIATTLAGIENALIASPRLAKILQQPPYHLEVIEDLRGRFTTRLEAYTWQFETLWKSTNQRLLVGLSPGRNIRRHQDLPDGFTIIAEDKSRERSANNHKTHTLDLTKSLDGDTLYLRFQDAFPGDGWGGALGQLKLTADQTLIAEFTPGTDAEKPFLHDAQRSQLSNNRPTFRFTDQDRTFTYQFKIPPGTKSLIAHLDLWNQFRVSVDSREPRMPWAPYGHLRDHAVANRAMVFWLDANAPAERALFEKILSSVKPGTPYLGWFGNDIEGEFSAVEMTSSHGVPVVPADWFNNLTVFSGKHLLEPAPATPPAPPLENKIYLTLTFGEGDNLQYCQHKMRRLWDDPARGKIPLNWSASPLLLDAAPAILSHYRSTATPNDLLVMGPSGVGYHYPDAWKPEVLDQFLADTAPYITRSAMNIPYILNRADHADIPLNPRTIASYQKHQNPPGILLGWGNRSGVTWINNVPVSEVHGISTIEQGQRAAAALLRNWDRKSPTFASLGLFAWQLNPTDILTLANSLGPEFKILRADHYFTLLHQARKTSGN
jgi:hypothetical protein